MKHIGIVGVSAEGAALCFKTACAEAARRLGGYHHPEITMHEISSQKYFDAQPRKETSSHGARPDWNAVADLLLTSVKKLHVAGADFAVIPSNTMHYAFERVRKESPIPLLSIVEESVRACADKGYKSVAVLGTKFTMQGGLYDAPLKQAGIRVLLPSAEDQDRLERVIFEEIVPSRFTDATRATVDEMLRSLKSSGADAAILGCTELPLVVDEASAPLPVIDTTLTCPDGTLESAHIHPPYAPFGDPARPATYLARTSGMASPGGREERPHGRGGTPARGQRARVGGIPERDGAALPSAEGHRGDPRCGAAGIT